MNSGSDSLLVIGENSVCFDKTFAACCIKLKLKNISVCQHTHCPDLNFFLFIFSDVNRGDVCEVNNGGCDHRCVSTPRGSRCMCEDGFKLHSDKKRCIGEPVISFCCFCLSLPL